MLLPGTVFFFFFWGGWPPISLEINTCMYVRTLGWVDSQERQIVTDLAQPSADFREGDLQQLVVQPFANRTSRCIISEMAQPDPARAPLHAKCNNSLGNIPLVEVLKFLSNCCLY